MIKNVPSVTMKLGSLVLTTMIPLNKPTETASASDRSMASHTGKPAFAVSSAIVIPRPPISAPDDRSNSPPIISNATATDMMPSVAAGFRYAEIAFTLKKFSVAAEKNANTASAPMMEPNSGRVSTFFKMPALINRSSTAVDAFCATLRHLRPAGWRRPPCRCGWGASPTYILSRYRVWAATPSLT